MDSCQYLAENNESFHSQKKRKKRRQLPSLPPKAKRLDSVEHENVEIMIQNQTNKEALQNEDHHVSERNSNSSSLDQPGLHNYV